MNYTFGNLGQMQLITAFVPPPVDTVTPYASLTSSQIQQTQFQLALIGYLTATPQGDSISGPDVNGTITPGFITALMKFSADNKLPSTANGIPQSLWMELNRQAMNAVAGMLAVMGMPSLDVLRLTAKLPAPKAGELFTKNDMSILMSKQGAAVKLATQTAQNTANATFTAQQNAAAAAALALPQPVYPDLPGPGPSGQWTPQNALPVASSAYPAWLLPVGLGLGGLVAYKLFFK